MRSPLRQLYSALTRVGIDPLKALRFLRGWPRYRRDLRRFKRQQAAADDRRFAWGRRYPCLHDWSAPSGLGRGHYFHQDLLVARWICQARPRRHIDIGSRIDGFVAHVASFRPLEVIDIRPPASTMDNIRFVQADFMAPLPDELVGQYDSVSCLHALEHFGLGRYGDPIRCDGDQVGWIHLRQLLCPGGMLYFSVPIGPQRIEFNAHRVYGLAGLTGMIREHYRLRQFAYVDDRGDLHREVELTPQRIADNCGCRFGCGIFALERL